MANNYDLPIQGVPEKQGAKMDSDTTLVTGQLVVLNSSGLIVQPSDAAGLTPYGLYSGYGADPATAEIVGGGEVKDVEVIRGRVEIPYPAAAQTDVGELFYIENANTVTKVAGLKTFGVNCVEVKVGKSVILDLLKPIGV